jgi:O-antigen chain-terminating methyltransferase
MDVEEVMERIRETIRRRRSSPELVAPANAISPVDNGGGAPDFASLHSLHDIRNISFDSHRRVLGPLVGAVKRILQKLLTPILERQVAYNAANVRAIGTLDRQLRREILATEARLRDAQSQLREEVLDVQLPLRDEVMAVQSRLTAQSQALEAHSQALEARRSETLEMVRQSSQAAMQRISTAERRLRRILYALQRGRPQDGPSDVTVSAGEPIAAPAELEAEFDYAGFEDRFRGSEEDIKNRQRIYVQYFQGQENVVDVGCGRGEFLELLRENAIKARGVDLDLDMFLLCRDKGLDVVMADAFAYLVALPDDSAGGIFAAQVIEHLQPSRIIELVRLCHRKLARGAALVLETPNPKCLMVFADTFYRDLSHVQPIHPDTMKFLLEATGLHEVEIKFLAGVDAMKIPPLEAAGVEIERFNQGIERLNALVFGFQDYAVIGRKA